MPIFLKRRQVPIARRKVADWFGNPDPLRLKAFSHLVGLCREREDEVLDPVTWEAVARVAHEHGLLGLVAGRLSAVAPADKPRLAALLRETVRAITQHNLLLISEVLRLAAALEAADILAVVFKGCLLSQIAHGQSHLRQVGDMDFLVRTKDRASAIEVLGRCGYRLDESWTVAIREGHFEYDCECVLYNPSRGLCVDLHWEITPRNYSLPLKLNPFFDRVVRVPFHGRDLATLAPEDQILVLCLHGAKHFWRQLEWPYTIAALTRQPGLDLETAFDRARQVGLGHIVASGLLLAEQLFNARLANRVADAVSADKVAWEMAATAVGWIGTASEQLPTPFQIRCFHALGRTNWVSKAFYWLGVFMTPTEKDYCLPLPKALHLLYGMLRLCRLLAERGLRPARSAQERTLRRDADFLSGAIRR